MVEAVQEFQEFREFLGILEVQEVQEARRERLNLSNACPKRAPANGQGASRVDEHVRGRDR
jgi:hypothetical protein